MLKKLNVPDTIKDWILKHNQEVRGYKPADLFARSKVWVLTANLPFISGKAGITLAPGLVILTKRGLGNFNPDKSFTHKRVAKYIAHEFVHVAQQLDMGLGKFYLQYFKEWLGSGLSYKRMKQKGPEKEAYAIGDAFYETIK